jgi:hypothetical protein
MFYMSKMIAKPWQNVKGRFLKEKKEDGTWWNVFENGDTVSLAHAAVIMNNKLANGYYQEYTWPWPPEKTVATQAPTKGLLELNLPAKEIGENYIPIGARLKHKDLGDLSIYLVQISQVSAMLVRNFNGTNTSPRVFSFNKLAIDYRDDQPVVKKKALQDVFGMQWDVI